MLGLAWVGLTEGGAYHALQSGMEVRSGGAEERPEFNGVSSQVAPTPSREREEQVRAEACLAAAASFPGGPSKAEDGLSESTYLGMEEPPAALQMWSSASP